MKTFLLLLLIAFASMTVFGQGMESSLEGMVSDQKGEGLPYATILLKSSLDGKVVKAGVTDEEGAFVLTGLVPGTYMLSIHMLTYKDSAQQVLVGQKTKLEPIKLAGQVNELSGVTVTARRELIVQKPDRIIMEVGSSVLAAGNSAYSILAIAPTLQVNGGSIAMQGKSNVVIFLDGKRMPGSTLESVLSSLPGEQIDRVEIITNPSAKYDADASGGVIEIFTKRTKALGWDSSLSGNFSQGIRASGVANGGFNLHSEKINLNISTGYNRTGHYEVGYDNRILFEGLRPVGRLDQTKDIQDGTRQTNNFSAGLNYIPKKGKVLGASVDWLRASVDVFGTVKSDIIRADSLRSDNITSQDNNKLDFTNFNGFYTNQLDSVGSKLTLSGNYATYQVDQNQLFRQLGVSDPGREIAIRNYAQAHFDVYTGLAEYLQVLSAKTSLESGVKYTHTVNASRQRTFLGNGSEWQETVGNMRDNLGYSESIKAAFVSMNHRVGKTSLQAGIRIEHSRYDISPGGEATYFNLFPNLRFDYKANKRYSTSLAYARNINRPNYQNLIPYTILLDNFTSRVGNPALKPEYAHSFTWSQFLDRYSLSTVYTLTDNAISQIIYYNEKDLRFIRTVTNFNRRHLLSANLSLPFQVGTWLQSNNTIAGFHQQLQVPAARQSDGVYTKKKTYYSISTYNSILLERGIAVDLSAYYRSSSMDGIYDYGAYSNISFGIKKDFLDKKAFVKLDVSDIFFQNNRLMETTIPPLVSESISRHDTRRLRISFRYMFGGKGGTKGKNIRQQGNKEELNRLGL